MRSAPMIRFSQWTPLDLPRKLLTQVYRSMLTSAAVHRSSLGFFSVNTRPDLHVGHAGVCIGRKKLIHRKTTKTSEAVIGPCLHPS